MMHRAYSTLETKSIDEHRRILHGVASTPETDRMGDQVLPRGAKLKLPLPFLYQHDSKQPIGHVTKAKVSDSGIDVEIQLAKLSEPGVLKDRLDSAWHEIRLGLVRGLSIGFRSLEYERIEDEKSNGIRFKEWELLEISAVTVAANSSCDIHTIRSIDQNSLAALGDKRDDEAAKDNAEVDNGSALAEQAAHVPPLPVVYLNDRVEQKRRIAKPNSKAAPDGSRCSVRIIRAK